jgi:aromatase
MSQHTDNSIVIDAPLELAWSMANDVESWPALFEGEYAAAEVLERDESRIRFRLTTVPENGRSFSWISERVLDEERHTVTARRIELGPFRYMHIFQSFEPSEDGVRLRWVQDFEVLPGAPFSDQQMGERVNRNSRLQLQRHKVLIEEAARRRVAAG